MRTLALPLVLAIASALPARAEPAGPQPLTITNASQRLAECAVVVDGHTRTMLRLHVGKSWSDSFRPGQDLRLVCERSRKLFFGPLKAGETYRVVDDGRWLDLADGA